MTRKNYLMCACAVWLATAVGFGQEAGTGTNAAPKSLPWDTSASVGLTLTRGNSRTLLAVGNLQAIKKWHQNELNLGAAATYGENDGEKDAESLRGYGQYNRLFTERFFGYLRVEALHDAIADVEYRVALSPGVGYYFIKNKTTNLRGEVGPGYIFEKQGDATKDYVTLRLAERFDHKLNDRTKIWQSVEFLPQVDRFENYIINAEIGIEVAITEKLSQQTYLQDTYDNEPAPGRQSNDLRLVAGMKYKF